MQTIDRRRFLKTTAGVAAGAAAGVAVGSAQGQTPTIPQRHFGGADGPFASIMGMGGSSQFFRALPSDRDAAIETAAELLTTAVEGGMSYFDTSHSYRRGGRDPLYSEHLYGLVLNDHRDKVMVATKLQSRTRDGALKQFELSLERLNMSYVDVLQLHSMTPTDDLAAINGADGAFQVLRELKEQKAARFIGITGHSTAPHMKAAVDLFEGLDTALYPVNAATDERDRRAFPDEPENPDGHFETLLLPRCIEKGVTVIAMKSTAQGYLIGEGPGKADAQTLIRYSMSVPGVTTVIVGPGSIENLRSNLAMAQSFTPMSDEEKSQLTAHVRTGNSRLAYLEPGYQDA